MKEGQLEIWKWEESMGLQTSRSLGHPSPIKLRENGQIDQHKKKRNFGEKVLDPKERRVEGWKGGRTKIRRRCCLHAGHADELPDFFSLVSFVFEAQQTARDSYCSDIDMKSESAASRTSHTEIATISCRDPVDPSRSHVSCFSTSSLYACLRFIGVHTVGCITVVVSIIPPIPSH
ncbi:uncharacterized protein BO88DRAFT_120122 [Aspergillus vadensis CBS 113365]|uniref:Uncharacterized protein n=1 Tax=Aspergillus vadensis (strain CBS 113365 / IMI 142717 / IBT 24658) TaxID=1448311 RepID=A0A319B1E0_ASPVC|nr:hypothetical protein BO88DRAFT_120122 [Aspergillus vadensis CBS 113365]PYH66486.1 hypothetical protein BO88DRAFT_120122 [Aspergillus vadensis CBS 113365]